MSNETMYKETNLMVKDDDGRHWIAVQVNSQVKMIETDESGLIEIEND